MRGLPRKIDQCIKVLTWVFCCPVIVALAFLIASMVKVFVFFFFLFCFFLNYFFLIQQLGFVLTSPMSPGIGDFDGSIFPPSMDSPLLRSAPSLDSVILMSVSTAVFPLTALVSQLIQARLSISTSLRLPPYGLPPFISSSSKPTFLSSWAGRNSGLLRRATFNCSFAGFLTVCTAGVLSHSVHSHLSGGKGQESGYGIKKKVSHYARVSILSCVTFLLLNGTFQSTSPSSLFSPGAFSRTSIPASGAQYSTTAQKRVLARIYSRHGCHTCGARGGSFVGDHVPPNVVVKALGGKMRQVFLPQCTTCSGLQGGALSSSLKNGKWQGVGKSMVRHCRFRLWWLTGGVVASMGGAEDLRKAEIALETFLTNFWRKYGY